MANPPARRRQRGYLTAVTLLVLAVLAWAWINAGGDREATTDVIPPGRGLTAVFIDVGQGDSILLLSGDDAVLVDAGPDARAQAILNVLSDYAVETLDAVIATHPHADHIGGLAMVLDTVPVTALYMPRAVTTTETFDRAMRAVEKNAIDLFAPEVGQELKLGDSTLTFLYPPPEDFEGDDLNGASIVIRVDSPYGDLLLTGDAETATEEKLLDAGARLFADVLKAGHHGSDTSTGSAFLAAVGPDIAVISCGAGNTYGHPDPAVLHRLSDAGAEIYRTDMDGTVTVAFTDDGIQVVTQKERPAA